MITINGETKKIGIALSGGGFRAAAFHLGTLQALHELKILDKVDVISTVSGGSIIGAAYSIHKNKKENNFDLFKSNMVQALEQSIEQKLLIRFLAGRFYFPFSKHLIHILNDIFLKS